MSMIREKIENTIESTIFGSRWLLAPFYLGLVLSIVLLFIKFAQELWHLTDQVFVTSESDMVIGILALIDM